MKLAQKLSQLTDHQLKFECDPCSTTDSGSLGRLFIIEIDPHADDLWWYQYGVLDDRKGDVRLQGIAWLRNCIELLQGFITALQKDSPAGAEGGDL